MVALNLAAWDILMTLRVSTKGTRAAEWDRDTWPELEKLARVHPESGVQFQGPLLHSICTEWLNKKRRACHLLSHQRCRSSKNRTLVQGFSP